jgi:hypothetical protein
MGAVRVRFAREEDLAAIVALTGANRRRLAEWEPSFWRPSARADERVVLRGETVVGFAASNPQPGQHFVDDLCVAVPADWSTAGVALLESISERPAYSTLPCAPVFGSRAAFARSTSVTWGRSSVVT